MATLLSGLDYKIMKWKNGRGETSEIARFPSEDPFIWRLSMAPVDENGPFSPFPGYDRYLTLLEGKGLRLKNKVIQIGEIVKFSGDENVSGELIDGKIIDLNLIIRRGKVNANFEILKSIKEPFSYIFKGNVSFIFGVTGEINITCDGTNYILKKNDTLQIESAHRNKPIIINEKVPNSSCILIDLDW